MDEVCGRVEPSEAGDRWGGARGRGAEPRGLEEEERDGREEQENRPPPRHQPHRSLPQATRCRLPPYSARSPCRCRRSTVVVGDRDGDASDRRRRHREGSGGEMVAVVGLPFSGWVGSWPGKREPNQGGPIYNASALWRATGHGPRPLKILAQHRSRRHLSLQLFQASATSVTCRPPRRDHELHTCHAQPFPMSLVSCFKERAGAPQSDVVTQG